jgi:hypothetical protein
MEQDLLLLKPLRVLFGPPQGPSHTKMSKVVNGKCQTQTLPKRTPHISESELSYFDNEGEEPKKGYQAQVRGVVTEESQIISGT